MEGPELSMSCGYETTLRRLRGLGVADTRTTVYRASDRMLQGCIIHALIDDGLAGDIVD